MPDPHLIALDWGTSNLRASLLDARGQTLETRSAPGGVMAVQGGQFAQALLALCADWPFDVVQLDDGFQSEVGDRLVTNEKFPSGLAGVADSISAAGFRPGLWIAPFGVSLRLCTSGWRGMIAPARTNTGSRSIRGVSVTLSAVLPATATTERPVQ